MIAAMLAAVPASAQKAAGRTGVASASRPAVSGSFARLSPGNRFIARALFAAQKPPRRWSRDRIAAAKIADAAWSRVFRRMRAAGLVSARSLGEVVSLYDGPVFSADAGPSYSRNVIITNGGNARYYYGAAPARTASAGTVPRVARHSR